MTLAEMADELQKYADGDGIVLAGTHTMAATVRAADELLGRCEAKLLHIGNMDECTHVGDCCETCKLLTDIRKIRGGGGQ